MLCAPSQSILSKRLSRDLRILAYSSGEFFGGMEIVDGNCAPFSSSNLIYIHCIDSNVKFEYSFSEIASLNLITVLGHVSFPSDLRSRRLVLFLYTTEILDSLRNKKAPVVSRVKASCFFEVSQLIILFFVSFLLLLRYRDKYIGNAMLFVALVHHKFMIDLQPKTLFLHRYLCHYPRHIP